ncbi:hypothetical protein [Komagataeibacter sp. FNDCF1]|uniref:hypothetical protein n=1 Tax=Komagataeibacter sp. FNDCF1 TaxID=2878681 RepID=UPI001E3A06BF|nr:hypothetical protein [Komagataeibacter sp. FNDCF1]MCE2563684.1 hypothetical protein [Komagataeibacter sp. FNDCF1]
MIRDDEDGILTEQGVLMGEIRSDMEKLGTMLEDNGPITNALRTQVSMIADKLDALSDLMR